MKSTLIRLIPWLLALVYVLGLGAGWESFLPPGLSDYRFPEHGLSVTLPRSLEGWRLIPTSVPDQVLLATTRGGLVTFSAEKTAAPASTPLEAYSDQQEALWRPHLPGYDLQIRAPERFGRLSGYTTIKEYTGSFLGLAMRRQRLDFYFPHRGFIYHVRYDVPEKLLTYFRPDYRLIITGFKVEK